MEVKHPETEHSLEENSHEDCLELAEQLLHDLADKEYPEYLVEIVKGIVGELKEYEDEDGEDYQDGRDGNDYEAKDDGGEEDGNPDEELDKFASEELEKKGIKPLATIRIGVKDKEKR